MTVPEIKELFLYNDVEVHEVKYVCGKDNETCGVVCGCSDCDEERKLIVNGEPDYFGPGENCPIKYAWYVVVEVADGPLKNDRPFPYKVLYLKEVDRRRSISPHRHEDDLK